jgi:hypothetical protein
VLKDGLSVQTIQFGNEQGKIICFDDFLEKPSLLIDIAANSTFSPYAAAQQRKGYPGVRTPAPAELGKQMRGQICEIIKREFNIPEAAKITPLQDAMCLMTVPEFKLGPLQTIPHFDASNPNFFATLLYLCGEEHGGTGFYRHNSTGYESITPERCDHYLDICYEELNSKKRDKRYFSQSDDYFTKIGFIPARFNRLVVYRGCLLHSANILSDISLCADPRVGRLTANIFFSFDV